MAKVYVGTYGKYACGSIRGAWLDLEDYGSCDEFLKACAELHKDEHDPELMFQDFEGFPREFYSESRIDPKLWEWLDASEEDRALWSAYQNGVYATATLDEARDAFIGKAESERHFAYEYWEDTGMIDSVPEYARNYIDYDQWLYDMKIGGEFVFVHQEDALYVFSR